MGGRVKNTPSGSALRPTGGTHEWRKIRDTVLKRDGYVCQQCGSDQDLTCDHIIPRSHGGTDDFENLQTLCNRCNTMKSNKLPTNADKSVFLNTTPHPYASLPVLSPMKRIEPVSPLQSPYDDE